jgi:DNA-binding response OmpR family regulator
MRPYARIDDRHLQGEAEHPDGLRYLAPEHQRILAVDDDDGILDLLSEALAAERYRVDVARSCEDALPLMLFHDYSGVLIDLVLPDANGLSLYRQIARRRPGIRGRVIFVTGALSGREAARLVRLAQNPVLMKPFDLGELVGMVHRVAAQGLPPRR